ncbi:unnamed protein product [Leptosia nina]|uniref:unspecific monooxygenase n=1 Tax=Leptosia nina TaxID=320188 RepID=A0AAV1J214_9NEOP
MIINIVLCVVTLVVVWIYLRWINLRDYWKTRGVPFASPHPIMGSMTFLQRENPAVWMRRIYDTYKSPYVGIWIFQRPALIINSPEIARRVLVKDAYNFRDRFVSSGSTDPIGALNLFTVNDPIWTEVRRRLTGVFTSARLKSMQPFIRSKTKELLTRIGREKSDNLSLRFIFSDITTDIISTAAFGVAGDATLTGQSPMREVTLQFQTFDFYRGLSWSSIFFCPSLVDVFGFSLFPKSSTNYFRRVFQHVVEQRKESIQKIAEPKDLLDALLKLKQENSDGKTVFSDDLIISQAAIFLQAGFDTSAITMSFVIYELAHHPDYQERLYKELLEAKEASNGDEIDSQKLSELSYLNAVLKETERKYPILGWLDRIAAEDYKVDDKLTIKAGTPIYVNAVGMHFDPQYFPDPEIFDPERFMPENEKMITPFTYMPFGEGPRNCIGKRFAIQNMQIIIPAILLKYEVRPLPGSPKPRDLEFEKKGLFLAPDYDIYVNFIPRETQ